MLLIGFRSNPKMVRFALVDWDGTNATLVNKNDETRLVYPKGMDQIEDRLSWLSDELDIVFRNNLNIKKALIKTSEYGRSESKSGRSTAYADAVIFMACKKANVPVDGKTYASLSVKSANVVAYAASNVGSTPRYWDKQMADAVVAAWAARK